MQIKNRLKLIIIIACCSFFLAIKASANGSINVEETNTKSGIKYYFVQDDNAPIIAINITFKHAGYAYDPIEKLGLANLSSEFIAKQGNSNSSIKFREDIESLSTSYNVNIDADNLYIRIKTLSNNLNKSLELIKPSLSSKFLSQKELAFFKNISKIELLRKKENITQVAWEEWNNYAFKGHSYSNNKLGDETSINNIAIEDISHFINETLNKKDLIVSIVGDFDKDKINQELDDLLGTLPTDNPNRKNLSYITPRQKTVIKFKKADIMQAIIQFGQKAVKRDDPDYYAEVLLNFILGEGVFSSRLMKEIRDDRGLAYTAKTNIINYDKTNFILGYVGTKNESVKEVIYLIKNEFRKIRDNGITEKELEDAKNYLIASFPVKFDKNDIIADALTTMQLQNLGINYFNERENLINKVPLQQANDFAKKLFEPENLIFSVVGDLEEEDI